MLYHERERKNEENANFVHIIYLLAKLCNIFDEAFLLTSVSYCNTELFDSFNIFQHCTFKIVRGINFTSPLVRQLHHVALDRLESHTKFPGPTT